MKITTLVIALGCLFFSGSVFSQLPITISQLRSTGSASTTQPYMITDQGKEGLFYYDSKDNISKDNGGTVIVSGSKRYKRMYSGSVDGRWFGMKGDYNGSAGTDNTAALNAALLAANNGDIVSIPAGQYYIKGTIALPLVTTSRKVGLEIFGNIFFARGSGFVIEGMNQNFRSYGIISGMNTGGSTESSYAAYTGTGVYLKNAVNCHIEVNEIKDFKYGIHISGDKSGGEPVGSQYNKIHFNSIHHNYAQIRISTTGTTSSNGNWNNASFWYGGQLGRGLPNVSYGKGGWFGILFVKDPTSNAKFPMDGHMFHDIAFEGLENGIVMHNASNNSFFGGRIEPHSVRVVFDLDPNNCSENKFIGISYVEEPMFKSGRLGINTTISNTPIWTGTTSKSFAGMEAVSSVTPNKFLITTNKYTPSNFITNKLHDLISKTGQYPTIQAMMYRINGVVRSVPYKQTFMHVKPSTTGSTITLPPNIGLVRVEASQAKVFKVDAGDMAAYGEEFMVEYLTPQFPISFIRADNDDVLIPAKSFPAAGTYRCLWADGQYKVSMISTEYKTFKYEGAKYTITDDIKTLYVNSSSNPSVVILPSAALWPGREITIKNLQVAKPVQVNGISASDENILQGRGAMTVKSDGSYWNIISFYKRNITY